MSAKAAASKQPDYGVRPPMEGTKLFHGLLMEAPTFAAPAYEALHAAFAEEFVGLTTDGVARPGLFNEVRGPSTAAVAEAAKAYLDTLKRPDQRQDAQVDLDHHDRRRWFNAFPDWVPSGVHLDDLSEPERAAALAVVEASLSPEGYEEARKVMRLNGLLGDYVGTYVDTLREFTYFFAIFGEPGSDRPWAWQLVGHHLDLNCLVMPNDLTLTPMFMGSEFNDVEGITVFEEHAEVARELAGTLTASQQADTVLYPTMNAAELPPELGGPVDGRHLGGAGRDNLVCPYAGLVATDLDDDQQNQLLRLVEVFLERLPEAQRDHRLQQVREHLGETYFAWIGETTSPRVFYYRIHSPVIWLEFDHHPGIFLDNNEPEPYHVHTIIRTPNGGDYGGHLVPVPRGEKQP